MHRLSLLAILTSLLSFAANAQPLRLSPAEIESLFLAGNLELLAERQHIAIADAAIVQARAWENPTLTVSDLSFWSSRSQREGEKEVVPPLFGSFGRNTQFSVELRQLIETAGKRKKRVAIEKTGREIALQEFGELLRSLKAELRIAVYESVRLVESEELLLRQVDALQRLTDLCARQAELGNFPKSEVLRLQAALFEAETGLNEIRAERNAVRKQLKGLLNLPASVDLIVESSGLVLPDLADTTPEQLTELALTSRSDLQVLRLEGESRQKILAYEKSLRAPDVEVGLLYDRRGGVWRDFTGVEAGIAIPIFNRNRGNIQAARAALGQNHILVEQQVRQIGYDIQEAWDNLLDARRLYGRIERTAAGNEMEEMMRQYENHLLERNIGLVEFLDFMEAATTGRQNLLKARTQVLVRFEELQFAAGTDLK